MVVFSSATSCRYDPNTIVEALEDLAASCKTQLDRDGVPLMTDVAGNLASEDWTPAFDLDTAWTTFSQLPTGFDDMADMNLSFDPPYHPLA